MKPQFLLLIPFLWCVLLFSCQGKQQDISTVGDDEQKGNYNYGEKDYEFPELDRNSITHVSNWAVFEDFDHEIRNYNGHPRGDLKNMTERLVTHVDSLSKKVPDTLSSRSILSRLLIVKTRVYLLNQELNKSRPDSIMLQSSISELNKSYANLIHQINEKFEKDAIDLQRLDDEKKELEKQKKFLDSVYQAELQDQSN